MRALVRRIFEIGARRQPHQAAIAVLARGEQHDARPDIATDRPAVFLVAEIDAERAADDRLDAGARHLLGEFQRTEHVVGVGQRQRRLAVLFGKLGKARDGQRALEQRIGRMDVQMHEARILATRILATRIFAANILRSHRNGDLIASHVKVAELIDDSSGGEDEQTCSL